MSVFINAGRETDTVLQPGDTASQLIVKSGLSTLAVQGGIPVNGDGGAISVLGRDGVGTNRNGGSVTITAGDTSGSTHSAAPGTVIFTGGALAGAGTPGNVTITGGAGSGATTGGSVTIRSGQGGPTGTGRELVIQAGAGGTTSGNGGAVTIQGGTPVDGNGGSVNLIAANGVGTNRNGGSVTITAGAATGTGTPGLINVVGNGGALVVPSGTSSGESGLTVDGLLRYDSTLLRFRTRDSGVWYTVSRHEKLTANRTYYIRTDGNDSNTGLVNNSGGAWATLQHAYDFVLNALDFAGYQVVLQLADGTYTGGLSAGGRPLGLTDAANLIINGNSSTPSNVVISTTSANCFYALWGACFLVQNLKMQTATSGSCIVSERFNTRVVLANCVFGAAVDNHLYAVNGGYIEATNTPISITGGATSHFVSALQSQVLYYTNTVTLTGTPAFTRFAQAIYNSLVQSDGCSFTGSATGQRYLGSHNSLIFVNGGGANFFPGSTAGSVNNGGRYV